MPTSTTLSPTPHPTVRFAASPRIYFVDADTDSSTSSSPKPLRSVTQSFHLAQITSKISQNCAVYAKSKTRDIPTHVRGERFDESFQYRTRSHSLSESPRVGDMPTDKAGRVVFVGNIPYGLSEEQVVHLFSSCGQVLNFRLVYDKDTGRPKGFGFAEFSDADAAASAVRNLNGYETMGRTLRVDYSNEAGGSGEPPNQNAQQQNLQQQNASQQQHFQQFQQMHQPVPQPPLPNGQPSLNIPPGTMLPDNVSAPDAISRTLSAMDPQQLLNVISQLKEMVTTEPQRAHALLTRSPQLSYAIFQALLLMGLVDTSVLSQVVEASGQQQVPQQQAPLPFHQPPQTYQPTPQPPQFPPAYQQHMAMGTPPVHGQPYPPPPPAIQKPPQMTDQQWDSIRQLCSIPQQQIDTMQNPAERQSIMSIRQQYMPFFGGLPMGVQGY